MKLYDDIIVYDDEGRRITNIATLRAIRESDEIAEERRKRWGIADDEEHEPNDVTLRAMKEADEMIAMWENKSCRCGL